MEYLLLSEADALSVELTEKQRKLRLAVSRVLADEEPLAVAKEIIEEGLVSPEEIIEMITWIKQNRVRKPKKMRFKAIGGRGRY